MQIKFLMVFSDPLEQENFPFQWVFLYLSQRFSGFHQAFLRKNIQIASCIYAMEYDMLEKNKAIHQYMLCFRMFLEWKEGFDYGTDKTHRLGILPLGSP